MRYLLFTTITCCLLYISVAAFKSNAIDDPISFIFLPMIWGYGDASCLNEQRRSIRHIDQLAANGMKFTDAHEVALRYAVPPGTVY